MLSTQSDLTSKSSLPQCGFGADLDFDSLINTNRFLFRVYTPKEGSIPNSSDAYFVAPRFNDQVARSPIDLPNIKFPETLVGTYAEVARHMEWTTKSTSCYISSSFSFAWAIWEAVKRYHTGVKQDVHIAVIDASGLGGRGATALQLLMKSADNQRDERFRKWRKFAEDSQTVLIYGMVPRQAVLSSIPLLHILRKLPSYFLRKDVQLIEGNPLEQVAWNFTSRKMGYHQFCRELSTLFLNCPEGIKLRDSTAGSVRLALAFLRPHFHNVVQDDFDIAISHLRCLAISISEWPADGWVRSYSEVRQIVDTMALSLGEELREKYAVQNRAEIFRLQSVIDGLEQSMKAQKDQVVHDSDLDSDDEDFDFEFRDTDETLVSIVPPETDLKKSVVGRRSSLKLSIAVLPRGPVTFQTPITPPESPRHSRIIPSATAPLSDVVSTKFSFKPVTTPLSETPVSPPLTPPPRSPVFIPPEMLLGYEPPKSNVIHVYDNAADEELEILQKEEQEVHVGIDEADDDDDDDDRTEPGDDLPFSVNSSPRSSIFSVETLCDNKTDVPFKRLSLGGHSRSDSYSDILFGKMPTPPASVRASRTVSFSKPTLPFLLEPPRNPLMIPLPPSPVLLLTRPNSPVDLAASVDTASSSSSTTVVVDPSDLSSQVHHSLLTKHLDSSSIVLPERNIRLLSPIPSLDDDNDNDSKDAGTYSAGITESAPYIVSGFVIGAFITLFLFSTQRRTLLYVT